MQLFSHTWRRGFLKIIIERNSEYGSTVLFKINRYFNFGNDVEKMAEIICKALDKDTSYMLKPFETLKERQMGGGREQMLSAMFGYGNNKPKRAVIGSCELNFANCDLNSEECFSFEMSTKICRAKRDCQFKRKFE
jgi:hypothetical protein